MQAFLKTGKVGTGGPTASKTTQKDVKKVSQPWVEK